MLGIGAKFSVSQPKPSASGVDQQLTLLVVGGNRQRFGQHIKAVLNPGGALLPLVPVRPLGMGAAWKVSLVIDGLGDADEISCTREARRPDRVTRKITEFVPGDRRYSF